MFVLVALLLWALPASSIAIERDRLETIVGQSKGKSPAAAAAADDSKAIGKLIDAINAEARANKRKMLSIITINTDVAGSTLEQEKARTGLSFGDLYVAHSLALATRKKFDHFVAFKAGGQSWAQIARAHKVSLKGRAELLKEMMKQ
jgi:PIN domain nuclease of toxin-antitoxin system